MTDLSNYVDWLPQRVDKFEIIRVREACLALTLKNHNLHHEETIKVAKSYENFILDGLLDTEQKNPDNLEEVVAEVVATEEPDPSVVIDFNTEEFKEGEIFTNEINRGSPDERDNGKANS